MNNYPRVSVIIPIHNHAHFLPECLASVRNQTYKDYEAIVVNNGSTDNTEEVIRRLEWDKLKYHYQDDTGSVAGPRNTGIRLAIGKYVAFLDSDDLWYEKKLEKVMEVLENNPEIDIISHDLFMSKVGRQKKLLKCGPLDKNMFKSLLIKNRLLGSATVVKKSVMEEIGGFDSNKNFIHIEDSEAWLRIAKLEKKFAFLNEPLGEYRVHESNLSHDFEALLKNEESVMRKHFRNLKSKIPFHCYFLYINRLSRIYFKLSLQYYFRKKITKSLSSLLKSFLVNPFYLPFNLYALLQLKLNR